MLDSIAWRSTEADLLIYTNACPDGICFWSPQLDLGCYGPVVCTYHDLPIFFHKARAVVCTLHLLCHLGFRDLHCLVVYMDNTDTVNIFHSLKAHGLYNELLKIAIDLLMCHDLDLRVLHLPGISNMIADVLSRHFLDLVSELRPSLAVLPYQLLLSLQRLHINEFHSVAYQTTPGPLVAQAPSFLVRVLYRILLSPVIAPLVHLSLTVL